MEISGERVKELSESVESLDKGFRERVARHETNRRLSVPRIGTDLTFTQQKNVISKDDEDHDDDDLEDSDNGVGGGAAGGPEAKRWQESIIKVEDCSDGDGHQPSAGSITREALERLYQAGIERQRRGDDEEEEDIESEEEEIKQTRRNTELLLNIMETEKEKRQRRGSWKSVWDEDDPEEDSKINEDIENDPMKRMLWAAENNEIETARELLESKAVLIGVRDEDGYTPLHRAAYNGHTAMVQFLLEKGADLCAPTTDGWQPLHCAARWNNPQVASLFVQAGCDVNAKTNGGQTALHLAASSAESEEIINLLLMNRYIDVTVKNGADETAYDIARRTGRLLYLFEIHDAHMLPSKS